VVGPHQFQVAGVTGHQDIGPTVVIEKLYNNIIRSLRHYSVLGGITSLAVGADQLFARCLIDHGLPFIALIPCLGYEGTMESEHLRLHYIRLIESAESVETLDFPTPSENAFFAAGQAVVDRCDILFAVWDGRPAKGLGGTADIVKHALDRGRPVLQFSASGLRVDPLNFPDRKWIE
jgi:hypothetical protein